MEYNFIVHSGGNPADIKMKYLGANSVTLANNQLTVNVASGNFTENIPSGYYKDTRESVEVNYAALGYNTFGFSVPRFPISKSDLIIDPAPNREWGTYYDGLQALSIAVDKNGNSFITGHTTSATGIATSGTYESTFSGSEDVFVAKFNSTGSALVWGTYYGGSANDGGSAITLDENDHVYVTGSTTDTSGIATTGAYETHYNIGNPNNLFVAKFSSTGDTLLWGTYYGAETINANDATGIALNSRHDVYITGFTTGTSGIATTGAYDTVNTAGTYAGFIAKFSSTGDSLDWATYYGTFNGGNQPRGIALDASDNVYIAGQTSDTGLATPGAYQTTIDTADHTYENAFAAKFNSTGTALLWGTYFGKNGGTTANAMALDNNNNVYITGATFSKTGMATTGAYETTGGGNGSYIAKFNPTGSSLLWASYVGANNQTATYGMAVDAHQNAYISGITSSDSGISTPGAFQTSTAMVGGSDAFIMKFDSSGSALDWGTYYGGWQSAAVFGMALDAQDNVYVTGATQSDTGIATPGAFQTTFYSTMDAFVAKFDSTGFIPTAVENITPLANNVTVYPNPSNGIFTFQSSMVSGQWLVKVYNVLGEEVYSRFVVNHSSFMVDLSSQTSGVYLYRVITENGNLAGMGKMVIEK